MWLFRSQWWTFIQITSFLLLFFLLFCSCVLFECFTENILSTSKQTLSLKSKWPWKYSYRIKLYCSWPLYSLGLFLPPSPRLCKRHKTARRYKSTPPQGQGGFYNELQLVDSLILHLLPRAACSCWLRVSCVNWRLSGVVMAPPVRRVGSLAKVWTGRLKLWHFNYQRKAALLVPGARERNGWA